MTVDVCRLIAGTTIAAAPDMIDSAEYCVNWSGARSSIEEFRKCCSPETMTCINSSCQAEDFPLYGHFSGSRLAELTKQATKELNG